MEKRHSIAGYIGTVVVTIILLIVVNNLLEWHVPLLPTDFRRCLPIINISLTAGIIANLVFIFLNPAWFTHLVQAVLDVIAFVAVFTVYHVYPFAPAQIPFAWAITLGLFAIMFGIAIAFIVELVRLLRSLL